ncbi:hypothetical protein [Tenacibaculum aiptasiae]|uniref:nuclear transport factor 2 family protein n=1 Tax=Tenacibaculum aiptasiae TaxID=426481 RepID=UPI00232EEFA8|nr:hypothetical protein [Tenacibaculum aiptasiae]
MDLTNKAKAVAVLNSIQTGEQEPISYINPNKYIQHNLAVGDGLVGFGEVMKHAPNTGFKVKVVRAFADGDYVVCHSEYDFFGPKVGFDVFRFENGLIVEHWDNLTELTSPNESGRTQLDGPTEIEDKDETEVNKTLLKDFISSVLIEEKRERARSFFEGNTYYQHNPTIADGLQALADFRKERAEQGILMEYHKLHKVIGEGNFVLTMCEGEISGKPSAYYDLFRISDNKIIEHWDVVETILPKSEWKNDNGKF